MARRVTGDSGDNTIRETAATDDVIIDGRSGNDILQGGRGNDVIFGGPGQDLLEIGPGNDIYLGGPGDDTYEIVGLSNISASLIELPGEGTDTYVIARALVRGGLPDNVENVIIQQAVDFFFGNDSANVIDARAVSQGMSIFAAAGRDNIRASSGDDYIDGGRGADVMRGRDGSDFYEVDNKEDQIFEAAGNGNDSVRSTVSYRLSAHLETLRLVGSRAEKGTGNDENNNIIGTNGANLLQGARGDDRILGNGGADTLEGNAGDDFLLGGLGPDVLNGGRGDDLFVWLSAEEAGATRQRADVITSLDEADAIDLGAVDADSTRTGNQAFEFVTGGFSDTAGELRFARGFLRGDRDGDGSADFFIQVRGAVSDIEDFLTL